MVLRLRREAPAWDKAKCLGTAPVKQPNESEVYDPWFDEDDPSPVLDICNGDDGQGVCPLRETCLSFALFNNEKNGVWGGMSESDRKITRKIWRWNSRMTAPHPEWTWRSHDDLQRLLDISIASGKIDQRQLEQEDDGDEDGD